jgi:hypothetical protein
VSALLSYEFVIKFFDFLQKRFQSSAEGFANYGCKGLQKKPERPVRASGRLKIAQAIYRWE